MAELVDAVDSKSTDRNIVPIQVRLRVPLLYFKYSKPLKLLVFSETSTRAVDKMIDTSQPKYTSTKRGVYYFSKSVPTDLRHHYFKARIIQSLRLGPCPMRVMCLRSWLLG